MNYIELTVAVENNEGSEIMIALLSDFAFDSFDEQEDALRAYIRADDFCKCQTEVETLLREQGAGYTLSEIEDVNWNAVWESNFDPIAVENRCMIRAPFHPADRAFEYDLVIMPKMAFGTGHHATTYLMAAEIMESELAGLQGLDMGSGTGVLAILAVKRGARHVDAIDIDEWAYANCTENIAVNAVADRITPMPGDAALLKNKKYDFILANINRNILLADMETYTQTLAKGGTLLISGILEDDIPAIRERAESLGMEYLGQRLRGGWAALRFIKK